MLNMNTVHRTMKEEFAFGAVRHILSVFDLDPWRKGHIRIMRPLF